MMTEPFLETDQFQKSLESFFKQVVLEDPLQRMRAKAWEKFLMLGLPTKKSEVFRYLNMRKLFVKELVAAIPHQISFEAIKSAILPECQNSVIVFVNGCFSPTLSNLSALPKQVIVQALPDAIKTYGTFLKNNWEKSLKEEMDPFVVLNAALHKLGVFVYLPPKCIVETPLQILHVVQTEDAFMLLQPRVQFFLGALASLNVVSSHLHLDDRAYFINQVVDFSLEDGSQLNYTQDLSRSYNQLWHFDATRAFLKRDCLFKSVLVTEGSATTRADYRISLADENSEASLNGMWMLNGKNEAHTHVLMDHQAYGCRSLQLFKGVLNDLSRSSFEGKILVKQVAQKTEAYQLNHNLLLSDKANADSKPNLEIFADDVKASHGATVGQLDPEQIFYLESRGFLKEDAKNILIYGFCQEVVDLISIPSLKERIAQQAIRYVKRQINHET